MGVFAGGLALAGGAARLLGRDPRDQTWLDLATLSAATFKAARTIARDDVTSFSRCVGTWAAAGPATTQVLAPRFGRLLTWALAGAAMNDFLQAGFAALTGKANELDHGS